jgi:hypothetical protein
VYFYVIKANNMPECRFVKNIPAILVITHERSAENARSPHLACPCHAKIHDKCRDALIIFVQSLVFIFIISMQINMMVMQYCMMETPRP